MLEIFKVCNNDYTSCDVIFSRKNKNTYTHDNFEVYTLIFVIRILEFFENWTFPKNFGAKVSPKFSLKLKYYLAENLNFQNKII